MGEQSQKLKENLPEYKEYYAMVVFDLSPRAEWKTEQQRFNICLNQIDTISNSFHYDIAFITNPTNLHYEILSKLKAVVDFYFIEKPLFESA